MDVELGPFDRTDTDSRTYDDGFKGYDDFADDRKALIVVSAALDRIRQLANRPDADETDHEIAQLADLLHEIPRAIGERIASPFTPRMGWLIDENAENADHILKDPRVWMRHRQVVPRRTTTGRGAGALAMVLTALIGAVIGFGASPIISERAEWLGISAEYDPVGVPPVPESPRVDLPQQYMQPLERRN